MEEASGGAAEEAGPRNPRYMLFRQLVVLKHFYSFRELEGILGEPSQVLWRYVTLRTAPEKNTVLRLLSRIRGLRLLDRIVTEKLASMEEPWAYLGNPGVMELAALKASEEFAGAKVVLSGVDEYSAALAGHVAAVLKAKLCLASMKPSSQNLLLEHTRICGGLLGAVGVPRSCLERGAGTLIVALKLEPGILNPLSRLASRVRANILGVFALIGSKREAEEAGKIMGGKAVRIVFLLNRRSQASTQT